MIDADGTGQRKLEELRKHSGTNWTDYEEEFLAHVQKLEYKSLSDKQKALVGRLHDKMRGL